MTIRDLVSFGRFPYSKGRLTNEDKIFVDEALEYMKLCDIQDKFLDEISGGQKAKGLLLLWLLLKGQNIFFLMSL